MNGHDSVRMLIEKSEKWNRMDCYESIEIFIYLIYYFLTDCLKVRESNCKASNRDTSRVKLIYKGPISNTRK